MTDPKISAVLSALAGFRKLTREEKQAFKTSLICPICHAKADPWRFANNDDFLVECDFCFVSVLSWVDYDNNDFD